MPLPLLAEGLWRGLSSIPYGYTVLKIVSWVLIVSLLKHYFGGARNSSERVMHGKVVMVTVSFYHYHYLELPGLLSKIGLS
jgi:hypothetical protein